MSLKNQWITMCLTVLAIGSFGYVFVKNILPTGQDVARTRDAYSIFSRLVLQRLSTVTRQSNAEVSQRVKHRYTELTVSNIAISDISSVVEIALKSKAAITSGRLHIEFYDNKKEQIADIWIE